MYSYGLSDRVWMPSIDLLGAQATAACVETYLGCMAAMVSFEIRKVQGSQNVQEKATSHHNRK